MPQENLLCRRQDNQESPVRALFGARESLAWSTTFARCILVKCKSRVYTAGVLHRPCLISVCVVLESLKAQCFLAQHMVECLKLLLGHEGLANPL